MTSPSSLSVQERAASIKLLLMDCDGVLTDGRIWILEDGEDQKAFHTRDGLGLDIWHRAGLKSGIISGRHSSAVERRARALGMDFIHLGLHDKKKAFEESLIDAGVAADYVAFIGDDLNDVPLMLRSGLAVAVGDGSADVVAQAQYVTKAKGGAGAVREVIELILKAQNRWSDLIAEYLQ
jgi:3-deoxy-D-manno-octulosonate 8-phosphate phosphatase (KDO 8-P phosphatase)